MDRQLDCHFLRRFGVEVEVNTLDGQIRKLDRDEGEIPFGADKIALMIKSAVNEAVEIQCWDYNYNNDHWIVKPDSSCGIEICTPVLKGWLGLKKLMQVAETLRENYITADQRCSLHVHVDIGDLTEKQLTTVIAWYIKCEHVIMDSAPASRKCSRYCQMIGMTNLFREDTRINYESILKPLASSKYLTANIYHFMKGGGFCEHNTRKKTIEFRIGENDMCLHGYAIKNWVRFLLHFIEIAKDMPLPSQFVKGDPWTGLLWLDPSDVFKLLKFDKPCSAGLDQMKSWFINRMLHNGRNDGLIGLWSREGRRHARYDFLKWKQANPIPDHYGSRDEHLYGEMYVV